MTTPSPTNPRYGLLTWIGTDYVEQRTLEAFEGFAAVAETPFDAGDIIYFDGLGGQRVYVIPSAQLVIVRTGVLAWEWNDTRLPNLLLAGIRKPLIKERENMNQQRQGPFFGWFVVGATSLCISTGPGPFAFAALGLFIIPFETEFGWERTQISACLTLLVAATAVSVPIVGRCVDKLGSRAVLFPSLVIFALCLAAIPAFVSELWHLVLVFFLIGTIAAGTNSVPYMPVLAAWFFKYRGLAIGISDAGIGLGYAYVPLLLQFLIDTDGLALRLLCLERNCPVRYLAAGLLFPQGITRGHGPEARRADHG